MSKNCVMNEWGLFPALLSIKSQYTRTTALSQKNIHREKAEIFAKKLNSELLTM